MKKLILSCSLMALTLPAYAADTINCATLPSCDDLGYTENADDCVGRKLLCPFDKTQAACLEAPHVGDLKYSHYSANHDGWLLCDGKQYDQKTYDKLYGVIGKNFCRTYSSRTGSGSAYRCDNGKFAVPDYRGFFLRGFVSYNSTAVDKYGSSNYCSNALYYKGNYLNYNGSSYCSNSIDSRFIPQFERLPNITGSMSSTHSLCAGLGNGKGALLQQSTLGSSTGGDSPPEFYCGFSFDASRSNAIYNGAHVVPANYAAYIFIYAGQEE